MALVVSGLLNKQVGGRARYQRDHGEGTPRQGDAEDEGRLARRPGDNGRETPPLGIYFDALRYSTAGTAPNGDVKLTRCSLPTVVLAPARVCRLVASNHSVV